LPLGLTYLGDAAFFCTALTEINIPSAIKSIGKETFCYTDFKKLTIPDNVESILDKAFYSRTLESVTLPESIRFIGEAFRSDSPIFCIYLKSKVPPTISEDSFDKSELEKVRYSFKEDDFIYKKVHNKSLRLYVPKESVREYKKAWKQYGYHKHIYGY
jgi:hypothetical protein